MATKSKKKKKDERDNSFFACRVSKRLMRAFKAHAKKHRTSPSALVLGFMATATGVEP